MKDTLAWLLIQEQKLKLEFAESLSRQYNVPAEGAAAMLDEDCPEVGDSNFDEDEEQEYQAFLMQQLK